MINKIQKILFILFIPIVSLSDITTKEDAISYYQKKYKAINYHFFNSKQVLTIDFSDDYFLTNQDLVYISYFPEATIVHLGGNDVTDAALKNFSSMKNMEAFTIDGTKIRGDGIKYLSSFKKIDLFYVNDNQHFTDIGLKYLSEIPFEQSVDVSLCNTSITDEGLKYLSKIRLKGNLCLLNTKVTDAGLKYLVNQKELYELDVRGTRVTKKGVEWLKKYLPDTGISYGKFIKIEN